MLNRRDAVKSMFGGLVATPFLGVSEDKNKEDVFLNLVLQQAAEYNLLVFDNDAKCGLLTQRLISLMRTIMRRNGDSLVAYNQNRMHTLIIPKELAVSNDFKDDHLCENDTVYGVKLKIVDDFTEKYLKLNGNHSLAYDDKFLVVGVSDRNFLSGSC